MANHGWLRLDGFMRLGHLYTGLFLVPWMAVYATLKKLGLDGPHRIVGQPSAKEMTIWRNCASGDYRITWRRDQSRVTVQRQQPPSVLRLVHALHFGRGYDRRYLAATVWALSVDAVIVSTWFWIVSGIYIWARRPKKRLWGGICLVAGGLLFAVLAILLCR